MSLRRVHFILRLKTTDIETHDINLHKFASHRYHAHTTIHLYYPKREIVPNLAPCPFTHTRQTLKETEGKKQREKTKTKKPRGKMTF